MMTSRTLLLVSGAVMGIACASPPAEQIAEPPVVRVVGHDFALDAPDSLPPGLTRFTFRSAGTVPHDVSIARVKQGVSLDSLLRLELNGADITGLYDPGYLLLYTDVGESVDASLLVTLERGRHSVLICTREEKGQPHSTLGMVRRLCVTAQ
ncbi:hypothetical protein [Gemmatimonas sp.]|uniref:hypothetical protein n=1 Tax=Gemmatimonas sp. TaxID=1962908 RepID=UPI003562D89B